MKFGLYQLIFVSFFSCLFTSSIKSRIIGGLPAHAGQFPFAAAIHSRSSDMIWFCGGSLYKNEWIITAGHCVDGATLFTISLGSSTLNETDENRVTLSSSEYFLHPDYDTLTLENDIGIIKLRMPVTLTDYMKPVNYLALSALLPNTRVSALGWGQVSDDDGSLSNQLNSASLTTLTNDECRVTYGGQLKDTMVCVGGQYNEGICQGDTGSGLILFHPRGYTELVAVASFVSANGCETTDPSGYTRVFPYLGWINNVTSSDTLL